MDENSQPEEAKSRQLGTKVEHRIEGFLPVSEVATRLGISDKTVRLWCEAGKLAAIQRPYGNKTRYYIAKKALELFIIQLEQEAISELKSEKNTKPHQEYVRSWLSSLSRGTFNGRAFSMATVKLYEAYATEFFQRHQVVSVKTLELALGRIPASSISKRQNFYKAIVCLGKHLIKQEALEPNFIAGSKVLSPKRHLPPKRHTVTPAQMELILKACGTLQDRLIIELLASTGVRASEACSLRVGDLDLNEQYLLVRCGKGGKARKVGLPSSSLPVLKEYLKSIQRSENAYVLQDNKGRKLDKDGLFQRVQRIGRDAGIKVSPHALRRYFVTSNANLGRPLQMLQMACGHSDIKTTMSYCRTSETELINAMKDW